VSPLKTNDDWVQDDTAKIDASILLTLRVKFGTAAIGRGEKYLVRAIATKSKLRPGPLTEISENTMFSEPVTVTSKKLKEAKMFRAIASFFIFFSLSSLDVCSQKLNVYITALLNNDLKRR